MRKRPPASASLGQRRTRRRSGVKARRAPCTSAARKGWRDLTPQGDALLASYAEAAGVDRLRFDAGGFR